MVGSLLTRVNPRQTSYVPIGPDKQLWWEVGQLVAMEIQLLQDARPIDSLGEADEPVVGGL